MRHVVSVADFTTRFVAPFVFPLNQEGNEERAWSVREFIPNVLLWESIRTFQVTHELGIPKLASSIAVVKFFYASRVDSTSVKRAIQAGISLRTCTDSPLPLCRGATTKFLSL